MALTLYARNCQPFHASRHDGARIGAVCLSCASAGIAPPVQGDDHDRGHSDDTSDGALLSGDGDLSARAVTPPMG